MEAENKPFDRSRFSRSGSVAETVALEKQVSQTLNTGRSDRPGFLKIEEGDNIIRWFPPHPDQKTDLWIFPITKHQLPFKIYQDSKKNKWRNPTPEQIKEKELTQIIAKEPVFNSRIHGINPLDPNGQPGTPKDIVEEYIAFAERMYKEKYSVADEKKATKENLDLFKKAMFPITNWEKGIGPSTKWIGYANKYAANSKTSPREFGRLEITPGVKIKHNELGGVEEANQAIQVNVYTDINKGKAVKISYHPKESDNRNKYKVALLSMTPQMELADWSLDDSDLMALEKAESLEKMYYKSYRKKDFEKAMTGLKLFDEIGGVNGTEIGVFHHDAWWKIVEEIAAYYKDEPAQEGDSTEQTENNESTAAAVTGADEASLLDSMDKPALENLIKQAGWPVEVKVFHSAQSVRENIVGALAEINKWDLTQNIIPQLNALIKAVPATTSSTVTETTTEQPPFQPTSTVVEQTGTTGGSGGSDAISNFKNKYGNGN